MKYEYNGKTLTGRAWYVGMHSNVSGRACHVLRFCEGSHRTRALVRWEDDGSLGSVSKGKTQWINTNEIVPNIVGNE